MRGILVRSVIYKSLHFESGAKSALLFESRKFLPGENFNKVVVFTLITQEIWTDGPE